MTILLRYNYIYRKSKKVNRVLIFKKVKESIPPLQSGIDSLFVLIIFRSRDIRGVEYFVSLVAAGLAEELVIETLDCFALMRLAQVILLLQVLKRGFEVYR